MHTAGTAFRSRIPSIKKRFITELRSLCCISGSIYLPPTRLFVSFRFDLSIVNVWRRNSTHHNQNFSALLFNCRLRLMWQQYFFFQSLATVIFDFWPEIQYAMVTSKKKRGSNSTAVQMTYKTGNLCHAIISFPFIHSFEISVPLSHIIHSDIRGRQSNMRPAFDSSCHVELLGLLDIPRWEKKHLYLMYTHLPYQVGKCRLVHSIIN